MHEVWHHDFCGNIKQYGEFISFPSVLPRVCHGWIWNVCNVDRSNRSRSSIWNFVCYPVSFKLYLLLGVNWVFSGASTYNGYPKAQFSQVPLAQTKMETQNATLLSRKITEWQRLARHGWTMAVMIPQLLHEAQQNYQVRVGTYTTWWFQPLWKYYIVSWDDDIPNIWKNMFQTTNQYNDLPNGKQSPIGLAHWSYWYTPTWDDFERPLSGYWVGLWHWVYQTKWTHWSQYVPVRFSWFYFVPLCWTMVADEIPIY